MPKDVASAFFLKKGEKKVVRLGLEDNEDVLGCIKQGMAEHKLEECDVIGITGKVKEGKLAYFQGSSFMSMELKEKAVQKASGKFHLNKEKLHGDLHITIALGNNRIQGTLIKGKASGEMEIELGFVAISD
ncbi:MAG: DUF296 domain-containing protein [archaeon]